MNTEQLLKIYKNKENVKCELTERLIKSGYQQKRGGYIAKAKKLGMTVDYKQGQPTQWWHLIKSYCECSDSQKTFGKNIVCGELIFWMAEVLECVPYNDLEKLVGEIEKSVNERKKWNRVIQDLCFEKIKHKVESI